MPSFHISWEIELNAADEVDAARKALAIQRDPNSIATVFDVINQDECAPVMARIDLTELDAV
jgi:hypothetical protein